MNKIDTSSINTNTKSFDYFFKIMQSVASRYRDNNESALSEPTLNQNALQIIHLQQKHEMKNILSWYSIWEKIKALDMVYQSNPPAWIEQETKPYIEKHVLYSIIEELEKKIVLEFSSVEKWETMEKFNEFLDKNSISVEEMSVLVNLMNRKKESYLRSYWSDHKITYEWIVKDLEKYISNFTWKNIVNTTTTQIVNILT